VRSRARWLGLDLGGTDIKLAVLEGEVIVETATAPTRSANCSPAQVLDRVVELGRRAGAVDSVGVSVPGLVDPEGRALLFPNLHGEWAGVPVAEPLSDAFGRQVPLLNDGHAFALAESRVGAARGFRDVVCVVCGTGVGGGLVLDGELRRGIDDRAGEIGHHTVLPEGELCGCGNRGCLETVAGARAIAREAGTSTFAEAAVAALAGDDRATAAFERAATFLGIAIANVVLFVSPERIVVGGGVAEVGDLVLGPLRREVERRAANVASLENVEIVPAELGPFAGAIGAALHGAGQPLGSRS
jgi:glucokinase